MCLRKNCRLIHETTHYLIDEVLFPDWFLPLWLYEGIAQYFECSKIPDKGTMVYGKIDHLQ